MPDYTGMGKLADPDFRRERARRAGQASNAPSAYVTRVVKALTENKLSAEDRERLTAALEAAAR